MFLDTETTGLGRDAGSLAFMVGLAWYERAGEAGEEVPALCVEQWTLTRMSGEPAMLAAIMRRLGELGEPEELCLLSFNGRTFDVPLLEQRLRRARVAGGGLSAPHLDLLYPARRLWRDHAPDCRLVTLERTQLGVRRVGDIPGHAIPAVFWRSIQHPECVETQQAMTRVREHNEADLVAMPALLARIAAVVEQPQDVEGALRVARLLESTGCIARAVEVLAPWIERAPRPARSAVDASAPARSVLASKVLPSVSERQARASSPSAPTVRRGPLRQIAIAAKQPRPQMDPNTLTPARPGGARSRAIRAARRVAAVLLRRLGRHAEAARQWELLCAEEPGDPGAHEALAKDLEHRRRDPRRALEVAAASSAPCPRRLARLERKLGRAESLFSRVPSDEPGRATDVVFWGPREPTIDASIDTLGARGTGRAVPERDGLHDALTTARADQRQAAREGQGSGAARAAVHRQLDLRLA